MSQAFTREIVPACCGKSTITYGLSFSILKEQAPSFEQAGFYVSNTYLNVGMLYAENNYLVVTGSFGSNRIVLKCKVKNCETMTSTFEDVITTLYANNGSTPK